MLTDHILANRIITPDGTLMESNHRHDYKEYTDKNGKTYMVDGGIAYLRRTVHNDAPYTEASVYSTDPHEKIREAFAWGTYGKGGNQALRWVKLKEMSNAHIAAILETQDHIAPHIRKVFTDEQKYRDECNIVVLD